MSAILAALPAAAVAQAGSSQSAAVACSPGQNGHGVTIQSCAFTLAPSPAGNANYYVNVTIKYAPATTPAVRFRCMLGNGSTAVPQYGVLRKSGDVLTFVSPFVSSGGVLKSVSCSVDAT